MVSNCLHVDVTRDEELSILGRQVIYLGANQYIIKIMSHYKTSKKGMNEIH